MSSIELTYDKRYRKLNRCLTESVTYGGDVTGGSIPGYTGAMGLDLWLDKMRLPKKSVRPHIKYKAKALSTVEACSWFEKPVLS